MLKRGSSDAALKSKEDIHDYFDKMASNPASALVLRLAFIMRKKAEEEQEPNS